MDIRRFPSIIFLSLSHDPSDVPGNRCESRSAANPNPSASSQTHRHSLVRSGKVSQATLPEEYKLAQLVRDLEMIRRDFVWVPQTTYHPVLLKQSYVESGLPESWSTSTPACEWFGVKCNDNSQIVEICWDGDENQILRGIIYFQHLPQTLLRFSGERHAMRGLVSLRELPLNLEVFDLTINNFQGELDLSSLPQSMKALILGQNAFRGEICLTNLPSHLEKLDLRCNDLSGCPDLTALPASLQILNLGINKFSGIVDLTHMPRCIEQLYLGHNQDLLCRMPASTPGRPAGEICKPERWNAVSEENTINWSQ